MMGEALQLAARAAVLPLIAWLVALTWPVEWTGVLVRRTAVGVGLVAAGLPLANAAVAALAARNRRVLLVAYLTMFAATLVAIVGVTLGYGALIGSVLWRAGYLVVPDLFFAALTLQAVGPVLGAGYTVLTIVDAIRSPSDRPASRALVGHAPSRSDAPRLWAQVDEVATVLGVRPPDHVVLVPTLQFEAITGELELPTTRCDGRILVLSLPSRYLLTVDEWRAVLAHELGHFSEVEQRFSRRFSAVFDRGRDAWLALEPVPGEEAPLLYAARKPARRFLAHFAASFGRGERHVARQRELALDRLGAKVTSPRAMAAALAKLHAFAFAWQLVDTQAVLELAQGGAVTGLGQQWLAVVQAMLSHSALDRALEADGDPTPYDSHPSLDTRLAALGVRADDVLPAVLQVPPDVSAAHPLESFTEQEDALFAMRVRARLASGEFDEILAQLAAPPPDPAMT